MTRFEQTLKDLFGYIQFELIGESSKILRTGEEDWLATSKYFSLSVDSRGEKADAYVLNLKLFQEQKLLLETRAKLSRKRPRQKKHRSNLKRPPLRMESIYPLTMKSIDNLSEIWQVTPTP